MTTQTLVGSDGSGASRRTLYRHTKRMLVRIVARRWKGSRNGVEPAVRRFLRARPQSYLSRLAGDRGFALGAAAALIAANTAGALPPIDLADVAAGSGGFVINGIDADDNSGGRVCGAGDVNGDDVPDFIVAAMWADPGGNSRAGECYVVFGRADTAPVNLSDIAAGNGGFVMYGIDSDDESGRGVAGAGDVNGDGLADLIIGAPGADPRDNKDAGESYVVFGKADGTAVDLADVVAGNGGFVINGVDEGDQSGWSVSGAGDVNGDGLDDVIVGAPTSYGDYHHTGESYVVFGKTDGTAVDLADVAAGIGGFIINGIDRYELSGRAVSGSGDVNGDGLGDVIVGTPGTGVGVASASGAGQAFVVFGKTDGMAVDLADVVAGDGGFAINGIDYGDVTGMSVSGAGDVNGDGIDDVIVGAPDTRSYLGFDPGKSYVVFGKADGTAVDLADVVAGNGGFFIKGIDCYDLAGGSVSGAGDVNGDGLADLIVGARGADRGGNDHAGESYVVFGKADGTTVDLADVVAGNGGFVMYGIDSVDQSGIGVSGAGDMNGDGLADLIVGASGADPDGNDHAGESYVVFSPVVRGDLDSDGLVGIFDLQMLLDAWGPCLEPCVPFCPGDLDQSCSISTIDLLILLGNWS